MAANLISEFRLKIGEPHVIAPAAGIDHCKRRSNNPSLKRPGYAGCAGVIIRQQIALCIGLAEGGG